MAVCILRVKSGLNFSNSILIDEMQLDMLVNRKASYLSEEPFLHSRSQSMSTVGMCLNIFFLNSLRISLFYIPLNKNVLNLLLFVL